MTSATSNRNKTVLRSFSCILTRFFFISDVSRVTLLVLPIDYLFGVTRMTQKNKNHSPKPMSSFSNAVRVLLDEHADFVAVMAYKVSSDPRYLNLQFTNAATKVRGFLSASKIKLSPDEDATYILCLSEAIREFRSSLKPPDEEQSK
jgi:hypothetical protein